MPIYEAECPKCQRTEDYFSSVDDRANTPRCACGTVMTRVISCPSAVQADLPGYQSPTTGRWIEGRAARRDDLKRSGARPWEGFAAERQEAQKRLAEAESRADRKLDAAVRSAYHQLPPAKRRALETP
jgi:hypothetical protein